MTVNLLFFNLSWWEFRVLRLVVKVLCLTYDLHVLFIQFVGVCCRICIGGWRIFWIIMFRVCFEVFRQGTWSTGQIWRSCCSVEWISIGHSVFSESRTVSEKGGRKPLSMGVCFRIIEKSRKSPYQYPLFDSLHERRCPTHTLARFHASCQRCHGRIISFSRFSGIRLPGCLLPSDTIYGHCQWT